MAEEKKRGTNREKREILNRNNVKNIRKNTVKKKKPFKTSAVVITVDNEEVSYSEVLAWAKQV